MRVPLLGDIIELVSHPVTPVLACAWRKGDLIRIERVDIRGDYVSAVGLDRVTREIQWAAGLNLSELARECWSVVQPSERFRRLK